MEQVLALSPSEEVDFVMAGSGPTTAALKLRNISSQGLLFKVKTTSPELFVVKPNQGFLKPSEDATVSLTFKSTDIPPMPSKLKFQIQAATTSQSQVQDIAAVFASMRDTVVNKVLQAKFFDRNGSPAGELISVTKPAARPSTAPFSMATIAPTGQNPDLRRYKDQLLQEKGGLEQRLSELEREAKKGGGKVTTEVESWDESGAKGYSALYMAIATILGVLIGSATIS